MLSRTCAFCGIVVVSCAVVLTLAVWFWPNICPRNIYTLRPPPPGFPADPCALSGNISRDLSEKGFAVVKSFFTEEGIKFYMNTFNALPFNNLYGGSKGVPGDETARLWKNMPDEEQQRVTELYDQLGRELGIRPERDHVWMEFVHNSVDAAGALSSWHQDHETFIVFHDGVQDYLNLYILLDKPDPDDAGLQVIPSDVLRARSPEFFDAVNGSAMRRWKSFTPGSMVFDNSGEGDALGGIQFELDEIACTPSVGSGDVLIMRGDTIHQTQKAERARRTVVAARVGRRGYKIENALHGLSHRHNRLNNMLDRGFFSMHGYDVWQRLRLRAYLKPALAILNPLYRIRLVIARLLGEPFDCQYLHGFFQVHKGWASAAR